MDPAVSEKVLTAAIVNEVGYTPSENKVRDGKKIATMKLYGSWEQSYKDLLMFLNALQAYNPSTRVDWYFKEHDLKMPIHEVLFQYLHTWSFQHILVVAHFFS